VEVITAKTLRLVAAAETLTHPRVAPLMRRPIRVALVIEIAVLLVVGAIPTWFAGSVVLERAATAG
jgi:hypothetical protein